MATSPIINWNSETEVCLFYAMRGHKPVGNIRFCCVKLENVYQDRQPMGHIWSSVLLQIVNT